MTFDQIREAFGEERDTLAELKEMRHIGARIFNRDMCLYQRETRGRGRPPLTSPYARAARIARLLDQLEEEIRLHEEEPRRAGKRDAKKRKRTSRRVEVEVLKDGAPRVTSEAKVTEHGTVPLHLLDGMPPAEA